MASKHDRSSAEVKFPPHLAEAEVAESIDLGMLFEAVIRYNASDRGQAFCTVDGLATDVFIHGPERQNRSVHGDLVVIRILPETDWHEIGGKNTHGSSSKHGSVTESLKSSKHPGKMNGNEESALNSLEKNVSALSLTSPWVARVKELLETSMKGYRATGEVVYIRKQSERRTCMVGCLRDYGADSKKAVFVPLDPRMPMGIVVDSDDVYCHSRDRLKPIAKHYYEAKITSWEGQPLPPVSYTHLTLPTIYSV